MKLFPSLHRDRTLARNNLRKGLRLESLERRVVFSGASPVAVNDLYEAIADEPMVASEVSLLDNDVDSEGDPLTAQAFLGPKHGQLQLNLDGTFTYTPEPGFSGIDGFVYQVDDGTSQSALAAVTIQVTRPNTAPVSNNDAYAMDEDGVLEVIAENGVLANDEDADGDTLSAELVDPPQNGTVELNSDGSLRYQPGADFHGADAFTYQVSDGTESSELAVVEIVVQPVNDAPVALGELLSTGEESPLIITSEQLLANDSDVDGDALTLMIDQSPQNGTFDLQDDGSYLYTPDQDFTGLDALLYRVFDGTETSELVEAQIDVTGQNDAPVAENDVFVGSEDTALDVASAGVLSNDYDVDGDALSAALVDIPEHGTVAFGADGSFQYVPEPDFFGVDAFTYQISDGVETSDLAVAEIRIEAVNDAPVASADAYVGDQGDVISVAAEQGVLVNDSDVEGDALTASVETEPANGSVQLQADGSFEYTPNAGFSGIDSFTYVVSDGELASQAEVTLEVLPQDLSPIANNDAYEVDAGDTLQVQVDAGIVANDGPEGAQLTALLFRGPSNGDLQLSDDGAFEYSPDAGFSGIDSFLYRVANADGEQSALAAVTIRVNAVAPVSAALAVDNGSQNEQPQESQTPAPAADDVDLFYASLWLSDQLSFEVECLF